MIRIEGRKNIYSNNHSNTRNRLAFFLLVGLCGSVFLGCGANRDTSLPVPEGPAVLTIAVMGDVPYGLTGEEREREKAMLRTQIADLNANDSVEFVVHVGDIKKGQPPCVPEVYDAVVEILKTSNKPLFIIPGDNEWNDCADPTEAWKLWDTRFMRFEENWPNNLGAERQEERVENFAFVHQNIVFLGINLVGGRVHDPAEWQDRIQDNNQWIRDQFLKYRDEVQGAVLFGHANPGKKLRTAFQYSNEAFRPFVELLDKESESIFPKPILFIHGDGHRWIEDNPFPNAGNRIKRVQVTQGGLEAPLIVEIVAYPVNPFRLVRTL
ncbi:MAG: hypothetical protein CMI18_10890 [Opitutaceae bacterium]|nr:hypothetical protein [Opitutaceae bacterium]